MNWTGKIVGFFLGLIFGGHIGAVIGLIIGHYFDIGPYSPSVKLSPQRLYEVQQAYFRATFLIMGHIAKADGRVSDDEIQAARAIMSNMRLNNVQTHEAIQLFYEGKKRRFNLDQALNDLYHVCGDQTMLLRMFIDIQFRAAAADGHIGPNKHRILEKICHRFNFSFEEFAGFYSSYRYQSSENAESSYQQSYQRQKSHSNQQRHKTETTADKLNKAYKMLNISESASKEEVKKAYRRHMSQNHPDKLIAKGLPEEMIKLATQKTQAIKEAYDIICASRSQ